MFCPKLQYDCNLVVVVCQLFHSCDPEDADYYIKIKLIKGP